MDALPDAQLRPLIQASLAGLVRAAEGFGRQVFPSDAGLEYEQNRRQHHSVGLGMSAAFGRLLVNRKAIDDLFP
jgi:hypothetical protein